MYIATIERINDKALKLLQQLEQLNILRLVDAKKQTAVQPKRKWAWSIAKETANKMLKDTEQSRNELEVNWRV